MRILSWIYGFLLAWSVSGKELSINFADLAAGTSPTNFHAELAGEGTPPQWKIVSAEVPSMLAPLSSQATPNHLNVLAQTSVDMSDEHFPMFIYDGETLRDFRVSTRFEIVNGIAEQMAGLVFRFQNTSNFYVARLSALGHNIRFYKVVNGVRSDPIGPTLTVSTGTWHTLSVQCDGNKINIFLDDRPVTPTLNDTTFNEGKVGFWTKSDSLTYFANMILNFTPRVPPAQSIVDSVMQQEPKLEGLRIYAIDPANTNATRVIASNVASDIGVAGTNSELDAINNGKSYIGREKGLVYVTSPIRDRNGDFVAAMRVKMASFIGETDDTAVTRSNMIRKRVETLCGSEDNLFAR